MAEFEAITTKEQLERIVKERMEAEREALLKKYSDYEEVKAKNSDYEKKIADYGKALEEANEKMKDRDKIVGELESKVKGYESESVKTRIAHEIGIPYELASRLTGEDEDSIRKDAETMAKLLGPQNQTMPLFSSEPEHLDTNKAALQTMLSDMKGE